MVLWCYNIRGGDFMAYFLKKSNLKKALIFRFTRVLWSFKKQTAHRSYKAIGYVNELIDNGIEDPVTLYSDEVRKLNQEFHDKKQQERRRLIAEESPERLLGYFPLKNLNDSLNCGKYLDLMQTVAGFRFRIFDMISALIYARSVHPCSKSRTYDEIIRSSSNHMDFPLTSYIQALGTSALNTRKWLKSTTIRSAGNISLILHTYFDCTNFYFEIDREDGFRRKGPSKENKRNRSSGSGCCLMPIRYLSVWEMYPVMKVKTCDPEHHWWFKTTQ